MKDLRGRASSGLIWSVTSTAGRQVVLLATSVILARLLTPHDFGLVATTLVFVNFARVLADQGLGDAIIQRPEVGERELSSIFWINLALGAALTCSFLAGASLIAGTYDEPGLTYLVRIVAFNFTANALGMVQTTILTRRLEFRTLAKAEIAGAWGGAVVGLTLAVRGWGAASIAFQTLTTEIVMSAALWRLCDWRPRAVLSWRAAEHLIAFGRKTFVGGVANYLTTNVDNILIGYRIGQAALGVYSRAYSVMLFPLSRVSRVVSRVMYPSFSLIQEDRDRLRRVFLRMTRLIALVTFPMMMGVLAAARPFVAVVFGPQWGAMVPVLQVLALAGMLDSLNSLMYSIYLSQNKPGLYLKVSLPLQTVQVLGIVAGLRWGIVGVGTGYAIATAMTVPAHGRFAGRLMGLGLADYLMSLRGVFLSAAAMALVVFALGERLLDGLPAPVDLGVRVLAGALVYVGLLETFSVAGWDDLKGEARKRLLGREVPA